MGLLFYTRGLIGVVVVQIYAAGVGLFGAGSFQPHATIGWAFMLLAMLLVVFAALSARRSALLWPAVGVLILTITQPVLVLWARVEAPALAALHPVVGVAILLLLILLERRAQRSQHAVADAGAVSNLSRP